MYVVSDPVYAVAGGFIYLVLHHPRRVIAADRRPSPLPLRHAPHQYI